MPEANNNNSILKKVLIHVIGWPLFFVAIYLCVVVGGIVAWFGVDIFEYLTNIDRYQSMYMLAVAIFHAGVRFLLGFFIAYMFGMLLFKEKRNRILFSLITAFLCAAFILFLLVSMG